MKGGPSYHEPMWLHGNQELAPPSCLTSAEPTNHSSKAPKYPLRPYLATFSLLLQTQTGGLIQGHCVEKRTLK